MYVLDTNILIYYANGDHAVGSFFERALRERNEMAIPTIVVVEFLAYPKVRPGERMLLASLLGMLDLIPLDYDQALVASRVRSTYGLKLADSVIAAAALTPGSTLVTRNARDFKKVRGLTILAV